MFLAFSRNNGENQLVYWQPLLLLLMAACWAGLNGCGGKKTGGKGPQQSPGEVVVYASLDREFSESVLDQFEEETGIRVLAKYDVESIKTVGLFNEIVAQKRRPRCDLFWNNELLHTLRLKKLGLLDVYASPAAKSFPEAFRSPTSDWYGLAARARVLIINTDLIGADERPTKISDLIDPRWKGRCGFARPLFGTTATHATVLFHQLGEQAAGEFFRKLKANARMLSGNKQVARDVAAGRLAFGMTDTDDAIIEIDKGHPVVMMFPDQQPDGVGTLLIPNSIAIVKNGPNTAAAHKLVDYLLRPQIEERLAKGESAQFPLNPQVTVKSRAHPPGNIHWMKVDFEAAVDSWDATSKFLRAHFD